MVSDDPESFADLDGHEPQVTGSCSGVQTATSCNGAGADANPPPHASDAQTLNQQARDMKTDVNIAIAKDIADNAIRLVNAASAFVLGDVSAGLGSPSPPQIPELQPSNSTQSLTMNVTEGMIVVGGLLTGGSEAKLGLGLGKALASDAQVAEAGEAIAGAGAKGGKILRQGERLASEYGGKPEDWSKMSSSAYHAKDGSTISTHWYQVVGTVLKYEVKSVIDNARWSKPF